MTTPTPTGLGAEPVLPDERDPLEPIVKSIRGYVHSRNVESGRRILEAGVKQYLSGLSDEQFAELVEETRPPHEKPEEPAYPASWRVSMRDDK